MSTCIASGAKGVGWVGESDTHLTDASASNHRTPGGQAHKFLYLTHCTHEGEVSTGWVAGKAQGV